jgi:hypothetical protein
VEHLHSLLDVSPGHEHEVGATNGNVTGIPREQELSLRQLTASIERLRRVL